METVPELVRCTAWNAPDGWMVLEPAARGWDCSQRPLLETRGVGTQRTALL